MGRPSLAGGDGTEGHHWRPGGERRLWIWLLADKVNIIAIHACAGLLARRGIDTWVCSQEHRLECKHVLVYITASLKVTILARGKCWASAVTEGLSLWVLQAEWSGWLDKDGFGGKGLEAHL